MPSHLSIPSPCKNLSNPIDAIVDTRYKILPMKNIFHIGRNLLLGDIARHRCRVPADAHGGPRSYSAQRHQLCVGLGQVDWASCRLLVVDVVFQTGVWTYRRGASPTDGSSLGWANACNDRRN
jgi:hypothetical protein